MVVLFFAQNIEITKFLFIKTALLKNKIIISFVKLVHKSFVSWNKKVRWSTPLIKKHMCLHPFLSLLIADSDHSCRTSRWCNRPKIIDAGGYYPVIRWFIAKRLWLWPKILIVKSRLRCRNLVEWRPERPPTPGTCPLIHSDGSDGADEIQRSIVMLFSSHASASPGQHPGREQTTPGKQALHRSAERQWEVDVGVGP